MFQPADSGYRNMYANQSSDFVGQSTSNQARNVRRSVFVSPLREFQNQQNMVTDNRQRGYMVSNRPIIEQPGVYATANMNTSMTAQNTFIDTRQHGNNLQINGPIQPVASTNYSMTNMNTSITAQNTFIDTRQHGNNLQFNGQLNPHFNGQIQPVASTSSSSMTINDGVRDMTLKQPDRATTNVPETTPLGRIYGSTEREKFFIFTGTVERVLKWAKIFQNHFCYFEVIASVVSMCDGSVNFQKIVLLNDRKGPILQVVFYSNSTYIDIEDFHIGQYLRCVGRMVGPNILSAETIRNATSDEVESLPRLCCICDSAVSHFLTS